MSNGVVTSACCCNQGCQTDCCAWWACSPDGEINVTLTGSKIVTRTITPGGQNWIEEEISWSITATMQRTGSTCTDTSPGYPNLYRYEAASCEFSWEKVRRLYSHGNRKTCSVDCAVLCCECSDWICEPLSGPGLQATPEGPCGPGDPCYIYFPGDIPCFYTYTGLTPEAGGPTGNSCFSWNCKPFDESAGCGSAGCEDVIEFRLIQVTTNSWAGTLYGLQGGFTAAINSCPREGNFPGQVENTRYDWLSRSSLATPPVLVVVCTDECGGDCVKPMLLFNPDSSAVFVQTEFDRTMDACCNANPCVASETCLTTGGSIQPWWIWSFVIVGKGDCLDATTFDEPTTGECFFPWPWYGNIITPLPPSGYADHVDMIGIYDQPCSPLERIDSNKECRDEAYMAFNNLYCAWEELTDPELCIIDFYYCYWNPWCETTVDSRTWGWNVTLGGA